ncbi:MAG TPA: endo-1,4-beta-xylanase, partial [Acidobacteriaceae bacterium]|nr:endo-1,4-beta-xylanase [Acidobacteriaceae bacterium]
AAEQRGLLVGTAVAVPMLRRDPAYAELIKQQANIVVAENSMKFGPLRPGPDKFFFGEADALFAFAEANGMKVRGHNFVWHRQLPRWFEGYATKDNAASILTNHIETVGGRYAGRVHSWDVVNEAIQVDDGMPDGLRNSPWYKLLGPGYIDLAYRTARKVDPKALLCYNDYDIESDAPAQAAKRAALLKLVRGMQQRNVPIDAIGIQSHIKAGEKQVYGEGLRQFMHEVQGMGLKMLLTEMDVNDRALPSDVATRDKAVASTYGSYLKLTLGNPDTIALLTWGITDKYTWLNGEDSRPDKLPERALPFDADLRPKPAYVAEVEAIRNAPPRG